MQNSGVSLKINSVTIQKATTQINFHANSCYSLMITPECSFKEISVQLRHLLQAELNANFNKQRVSTILYDEEKTPRLLNAHLCEHTYPRLVNQQL